MASPNAGPITGRERIRIIQGGWEVWVDRPQFVSLIALAASAPLPRPYATPTTLLGTERLDAWQDGNKIILDAADLATFTAGSGVAPTHPDPQKPTGLTGAERIVGYQGGARVAFTTAEIASVITLAGGSVTLNTLSLSGSLQIGTAASGTIIGATVGSTITGNIPGITVNSAARTYSGTPTGSAATITNGLVETLAGATNTPNNSSVTVAAAAITLSALSLSPLSATPGVAYSGTISAATAGSTITATSSDGTTLTVSGSGTTRTLAGTFSGAGSPTITMTETLAGASNSPNTSTATVSVSAAAAAAFTMTQLAAAARPYQRSTRTGGGQSKGQGTIPVTLPTVTAAGTLYARCRSAADGTTILQASWLAATLGATGAQTVNITGVDARSASFYLDLSGDNVSWTSGTTAVQMGRLIAIHGQSMGVRWMNILTDVATYASLGITPSSTGRVLASWSESGHGTYQPTVSTMTWQLPGDGTNYTSVGIGSFLLYQEALSGVACGVIGHVVGATASSVWVAGATGNLQFRAVCAQAGGAWEADFFFDGHSDAAAGTSSATFQSNLTNIFNDVTSQNSFSGYEKYVASIPWITGTTWGQANQIMTIRQAMATWAAANSATHVSIPDMKTLEGVHPGQLGSITISQHLSRATRATLGLTGSDTGPTFGTPSRSGVTVTIPAVLQTGATSVTLTGATNMFKVYRVGDTTYPLAVTAASYSGGNFSLTLKGDPGTGQALDLYLARDPALYDGNDGSIHNIRDNHIDADETAFTGNLAYVGRAMAQVTTPVSIPLITVSGTLLPFPGYDLTVTTPTYAAGKFSNALSAGFGKITNMPVLQSFTWEMWILVPSTPAATSVLMGFTNCGYMALTTSGFLTTTGTPAATMTASTNLGDNTWHHIAFSVSGTNAFMFVDGVQVTTTSTITTPRTGTDDTLSIRSLNGNFVPASGVLVDEAAYFNYQKYTTGFTPPTSAYAGNETGLVALYHLDSNGLDSATATK